MHVRRTYVEYGHGIFLLLFDPVTAKTKRPGRVPPHKQLVPRMARLAALIAAFPLSEQRTAMSGLLHKGGSIISHGRAALSASTVRDDV